MQQIRILMRAVVAVAVLCTSGGLVAQRADSAAALLEAARQKAVVEGDLAAAITQYQAIVDRFATSDRRVAAEALLGIGDAEQKLGRIDSARLTFGRLVRDFPDERAAGEARARLAGGGTQPSSRRIRMERGDSVSADGRSISSVADGGVVFVHDVVTGTDERLTEPADQLRPGQYAEVSAISRDGRQVAYSWSIGPRYQLRLVSRASAPGAAPRVLVDNPEITFVTPLDWSPDGRTVVVRLGRADRTARLALVSTASDQLSELKSIDWQGPIEAAFSPDGRFIAYDAVADEKRGQRDILLLSTDATREERVVQSPFSDVVAGWSPDGRLLLFLSNRSGANAVFGQAIADGRAVGAPTLLRADLGTLARIVGTTRTGALFVVQRTSAFQVHTATVDFATGAVLTPGAPVLETYLQGQRFPVWSPDGKQLAWSSPLKSGQPGVGATVLSLETGRATEIAAELAYGVLRAWAPDGGLTYQGSDLKGRHGLFRVDPRDGRTTAIALANDGFFSLPSWSGDGRYIVYRNQVPKSPGMILRDMVTGTERELVRSRPFGYLALAPDGKHVAFTEGSTTPHSILLIAVDTGETREVFRVPDTEIVATFHWLPDSRRLVVWKSVGDKSTGAVISLAGGPPVPLDPAIPAELQMHPDGRRIAYTAGTRTLELWAHEHFLPAATAQ